MIGRDTNLSHMEYPEEILISLDGNEDYAGRIVINEHSGSYTAEIDIINLESRKIFKHIGMLFKLTDADEAKKQAVQLLSEAVSPGQT